jgi:hypothetical protein
MSMDETAGACVSGRRRELVNIGQGRLDRVDQGVRAGVDGSYAELEAL